MAAIPLGPWAPDSSGVDDAALSLATNVFPEADGYGPIKGPSAVSLALPGACKGAIAVKSKSGSPVFFAGTASGLYRFNSVTQGWDDVSKPGNSYFVPDTDFWSWSQYGQQLLVTHVNDTVQTIDIDTGTNFANLGGSPPRARFVGVVGDFVVLGGLLDFPSRIQWSGLNDASFWTPGLNLSDFQEFPDGGQVTAFSGGEFGVVFQETVIRRMIFAPGSAEIFQFSRAEDGRGAVAPWSTIRVGPQIFFLDRDGFYKFTGGSSAPIGAQRVNAWFVDNADPAYLAKTVAVADVKGPRILWSFKSQGASDPNLLDTGVIYDWVLDRWAGPFNLPIRFWIGASTPAVSIDSIVGSIDALTTSLDSAIYTGGIPTLGVFGTDNKLSFLEGPNLEAVMETADAQVARPNRAFVRGVRLDSDVDQFGVQVAGRESLGAAPTYSLETFPSATRFAPCRVSARYHRGRIRIPAGSDWTYAKSIEIDGIPEGGR